MFIFSILFEHIYDNNYMIIREKNSYNYTIHVIREMSPIQRIKRLIKSTRSCLCRTKILSEFGEYD